MSFPRFSLQFSDAAVRPIHTWSARIAAVLLGFTGVLKLAAAHTEDRILLQPDALLNVRNRTIFVSVGAIEIAVCIILLCPVRVALKLTLLAWLVGAFTIYRLAAWAGGLGPPCPCLGTGFRWWPWLSRHHTGAAMGAYVVLCVATLVFASVYLRRNTRRFGFGGDSLAP